jgi:hypothetical protein
MNKLPAPTYAERVRPNSTSATPIEATRAPRGLETDGSAKSGTGPNGLTPNRRQAPVDVLSMGLECSFGGELAGRVGAGLCRAETGPNQAANRLGRGVGLKSFRGLFRHASMGERVAPPAGLGRTQRNRVKLTARRPGLEEPPSYRPSFDRDRREDHSRITDADLPQRTAHSGTDLPARRAAHAAPGSGEALYPQSSEEKCLASLPKCRRPSDGGCTVAEAVSTRPPKAPRHQLASLPPSVEHSLS